MLENKNITCIRIFFFLFMYTIQVFQPTIYPDSICLYKKGCICKNNPQNLVKSSVNITYGDICKYLDSVLGTMVTYEHTADGFLCNDTFQCECGQSDQFYVGTRYCLRKEDGTQAYFKISANELGDKKIVDQAFLSEKINSLKSENRYGNKANIQDVNKNCIYPETVSIPSTEDKVTFFVDDNEFIKSYTWEVQNKEVICYLNSQQKKLIV